MKIKRFILLLIVMAFKISMQSQESQIGTARWISTDAQKSASLPVFRKTVELKGQPKHATLQATSLGIYDVCVNGHRIEGHELKPGWTDYRREVTFQTMDVTSLLHKGRNERATSTTVRPTMHADSLTTGRQSWPSTRCAWPWSLSKGLRCVSVTSGCGGIRSASPSITIPSPQARPLE